MCLIGHPQIAGIKHFIVMIFQMTSQHSGLSTDSRRIREWYTSGRILTSGCKFFLFKYYFPSISFVPGSKPFELVYLRPVLKFTLHESIYIIICRKICKFFLKKLVGILYYLGVARITCRIRNALTYELHYIDTDLLWSYLHLKITFYLTPTLFSLLMGILRRKKRDITVLKKKAILT